MGREPHGVQDVLREARAEEQGRAAPVPDMKVPSRAAPSWEPACPLSRQRRRLRARGRRPPPSAFYAGLRDLAPLGVGRAL